MRYSIVLAQRAVSLRPRPSAEVPNAVTTGSVPMGPAMDAVLYATWLPRCD